MEHEVRGLVHLAGNAVIIGSRHIQRCLVCGYKIIDDDLARMASPDGPVKPLAFTVGNLVRIIDGNPKQTVVVCGTAQPQFAEEWEDCCLSATEGVN